MSEAYPLWFRQNPKEWILSLCPLYAWWASLGSLQFEPMQCDLKTTAMSQTRFDGIEVVQFVWNIYRWIWLMKQNSISYDNSDP